MFSFKIGNKCVEFCEAHLTSSLVKLFDAICNNGIYIPTYEFGEWTLHEFEFKHLGISNLDFWKKTNCFVIGENKGYHEFATIEETVQYLIQHKILTGITKLKIRGHLIKRMTEHPDFFMREQTQPEFADFIYLKMGDKKTKVMADLKPLFKNIVDITISLNF